MTIECITTETGQNCSFDLIAPVPDYIEIISTPSGDFYFSNIITTTDILISFIFIIFLIIFIIKTIFKLFLPKLTYLKSKNYD